MSRVNVEVVKAAIDAANREDWDALIQAAAPNFELDMSRSRSFRGAAVYGLDQLRGFLVEFAESWESVQVEPHEFIEAGDLVVVPWTTHARGRDGIEVVSRPTFVWTIRDGAIERLSMYQERQEALEALGLSESATSKADIKTLRGVYEAISRGDWDAAFRDAHPGLEYKVLDRDPGTGTYRGREEVRRVLEDQLEAFEEVVAEPEGFFLRGDQIVVFVRIRSRPRGSSATVEIRVAHLWTMRDGKAARFELFPVREEALEAAGLSEQDAHGDSWSLRDTARAMSQENVEIVRQFYESVTRQDLDGVLDCVHADIELDWSASRSPWRGIYKGHDGLMRFWTEQIEGWKEFSLELAEAIEYDRDRVLAVTVMRGRGEGSGISTKAAGATLWTIRDGRVLSGRLFQTKEEALEAAGLPE